MTAYFQALANQDLDAIAGAWAPGGVMTVLGDEATGPDGLRAYWAEFFGAAPDLRFEVQDMVAEGDQVAVHWAAKGTFAGPNSFQGIEPTYSRLDLAGLDIFDLRDGKIVRERAYTDGSEFARQIGMLPPAGSTAEQRVTRAFNGQAKLKRRAVCAAPERIAEGVWIVRGGFPLKTMNVYLLEDEGGLTLFDAGISDMTVALAAAAARLGGIRRIVLSHADADHRGAAPGLDAPAYCHPADREAAESPESFRPYWDLSKLAPHGRLLLGRLFPAWDGGAVEIEGTVQEGDQVAGFKVIDLPGHAPGLIGLYRESDRLALVSDLIYTLDPQTGIKGRARLPHPAFDIDTGQARASIRKLAAISPSVVWSGHADPVRGDVGAQLESAASAPV